VNALSPAPIAVDERVLEDLRSRLRATIWPEDQGNEDGRYGVPRVMLQELVRYWAEEYDWRAAERAMNAYEHYLVDVSGTRVHFMRKPGAGPNPVPLILSHGWPWTFWHWSKVIDRLADPAAFGGDRPIPPGLADDQRQRLDPRGGHFIPWEIPELWTTDLVRTFKQMR
jgi:hypothetical protein